jgi:Zn-dependent alcohol dehydrogenase
VAQEVKGVVSHTKGEPVEVTTVVVPDPGPGEALDEIEEAFGKMQRSDVLRSVVVFH